MENLEKMRGEKIHVCQTQTQDRITLHENSLISAAANKPCQISINLSNNNLNETLLNSIKIALLQPG